MPTTKPIVISAVVEGTTDEAVARRLIREAGAAPGPVYGKKGKYAIQTKIRGYNQAAMRSPWFVLVDLNNEAACAPTLRKAWLDDIAPLMCFRVAVREVETWLLADRQAISAFFGVSVNRVPGYPETLEHPKREMVNLAGRSRSQAIREDMVPTEGSGRKIGPAYTSRLLEFVQRHWRPGVAVNNSDSLKRTLACLKELAAFEKALGS